jgi:hypothetical protein
VQEKTKEKIEKTTKRKPKKTRKKKTMMKKRKIKFEKVCEKIVTAREMSWRRSGRSPKR